MEGIRERLKQICYLKLLTKRFGDGGKAELKSWGR
jgi:hypothetical protein